MYKSNNSNVNDVFFFEPPKVFLKIFNILNSYQNSTIETDSNELLKIFTISLAINLLSSSFANQYLIFPTLILLIGAILLFNLDLARKQIKNYIFEETKELTENLEKENDKLKKEKILKEKINKEKKLIINERPYLIFWLNISKILITCSLILFFIIIFFDHIERLKYTDLQNQKIDKILKETNQIKDSLKILSSKISRVSTK